MLSGFTQYLRFYLRVQTDIKMNLTKHSSQVFARFSLYYACLRSSLVF
ncbi:hypothetical protein DYBT9275_05491 [Dyadobacter sp. CECT 9275]|uniref:Uncharacterized protein n=1 Tax=Dyadobacter helix TaxID=2822344 RepID=A0A916N7C9_9BACT|nr:hypothetical protein DYBT9275_05491 [Dyadobacter sp. CECT 9275]